MKMTLQRASSMNVHLGKQERMEHEHSNKHIDKTLSHMNYTIGCDDYSDALQRMKDRTKEVDAIQPPKRLVKDRVVSCMLEIPCPLQLQEQGKDAQFFQTMYNVVKDYFGAENVHGAFVHLDEQHEYVGKDGNDYISLRHAHVLVSAYTPEKGINGKAFETRTRLHQFNDLANKVCEREFGIELNTHGLAGKQSVEYLKIQQERNEAVQDLNMSRDALQLNKDDAIEIQQRIEQKHEELARIEHQNARELKKRERMGKTWLGKKKDRIEVDRSEFERVLEYCNNSSEREEQNKHEAEQNRLKEEQLKKLEQELAEQQRNIQNIIDEQVRLQTLELTERVHQRDKELAEKQATIQKINEFLKQPIYLENYELSNVQCSVSLTVGHLVKEWKNNNTAPINALESLVDAQKRNNVERVVNMLNRAYEEQEQEQPRCSYRSRDDDWER